MITVRTGSYAAAVCLVLLLCGCSREQQDWRSAEAADTIESYSHFVQRHPESELAVQARTRITQLGEERDWQHAGSADTPAAYREFLAQHPNGKWAQEARIRIENFSLGAQAGTASPPETSTPGGSKVPAGVPPPPAASAAGSEGPAKTSVLQTASTTGSKDPAGASATSPPQTTAQASTAPVGAPQPAPVAPASKPIPAAPGATAPPLAPETAPASAFAIQLGAFSNEAAAHAEWHSLTARFGAQLQGLHEHVTTADTPSGRIYRLRATVGDESHARALCEALRKHGQACVAVPPH